MAITVIEGEQRGDEGKGRFVDMLAPDFDVVARYNGGPNAGHTVSPDGERVFKLHQVPSGIVHPGVMNVIGNGVFMDPIKLVREIAEIESQGVSVTPDNLMISSATHMILPQHVFADEIREAGKGAQGSTKSGMAQVAAARAMREGTRAEIINNNPALLFQTIAEGLIRQTGNGLNARLSREVADDYVRAASKLGAFVTDTALYLNRQLKAGNRILAEGAQAFLLDPDHGMYPFVTSSTPGAGGVSPGLGVPPTAIEKVIGIVKATQSHVGGGPFVTEIDDPIILRKLHGDMTTIDAEKGTTTGRVRRLGHLDLPSLRRAQMINGTSEMAITKLDWLTRYGHTIMVCIAYERKGKLLKVAPDAAYKLEQSIPIYTELRGWKKDISDVRHFKDLPKNARDYINFLEEQTETPVTMIGVGPGREQVVDRR